MELVRSGMVIGLGTGSTSDFFLQALAAALKAGMLRDVRGVPTSRRSEQRARELGIRLTTLAEAPHPDITIDGADEITPSLDLIKGLGGALLREKMLAQASNRLVIIADSSKCVPYLGARSPLPVEVVPFCHEVHVPFLRSLGAQPALRKTPEGTPYVTDNSNYIYDCRFQRIDDPTGLENALSQRAGIVGCGLFTHMAEMAIVADDGIVRKLRR